MEELIYTVQQDSISISPKWGQFQLVKLESGTPEQREQWAKEICEAVNNYSALQAERERLEKRIDDLCHLVEIAIKELKTNPKKRESYWEESLLKTLEVSLYPGHLNADITDFY